MIKYLIIFDSEWPIEVCLSTEFHATIFYNPTIIHQKRIYQISIEIRL